MNLNFSDNYLFIASWLLSTTCDIWNSPEIIET